MTTSMDCPFHLCVTLVFFHAIVDFLISDVSYLTEQLQISQRDVENLASFDLCLWCKQASDS